MTATQETGTAQAIFKRRYVDGVKNLQPTFGILQREIAFDSSNKVGDRYERAVMLRYPNGATYGGGSNLNTVYSYNDPRAGATQPAYVKPCEYTLREQVAYGLVSKAATSEQAFASAMDVIVMGMDEASKFHLETMLLYGGTSLGAANADATGAFGAASCVISKATWAAALWSAAEGMELDNYDSTLTTLLNTNGPIQVTGVDASTRTLSLVFAANGDFAACDTGTVFVPRGAKANWADGLDAFAVNSVAGTTTLGISPATYGMWKANAFSTSSTFTFTKAAQAASAVAARGGIGDLQILLSSWTWTDVMNDQAALRQYVGSMGGEIENGADRLVYHGPNGGKLTFMQHPLVKAGEAFVLNFEDFKRIGDSEPTFNLPGRGSANNPMFLLELPSSSGFEVRRWWSQALFCDRLARVSKITGIVNASL